MKINQFFSEILGANVRNPRWSWGAVEPVFNRIYLRVWGDQIETIRGKEFIPLDWDEYFEGYRSNGISERRAHVESIRNGSSGYGVVCTPSSDEADRKIHSFDADILLELGAVKKSGGRTLAEIVGRVPVAKLSRKPTGASTAGSDIAGLLRCKIEKTTRESLIDARVGQGKFRQDVLNQWKRRCAVSGCAIEEAIRASHIKPWRDSNNEERLDPENGLPLIATLDALFDAGLVSFSQSGKLLVSTRLPMREVKKLGLSEMKLSKKPSMQQNNYLDFHRGNIYE